MIVDDHPVNRLLLESVLELEAIDVLGAGSIAEAERVLERSVPPVIVLDLRLPDGYGLDLVRLSASRPADLGMRDRRLFGRRRRPGGRAGAGRRLCGVRQQTD